MGALLKKKPSDRKKSNSISRKLMHLYNWQHSYNCKIIISRLYPYLKKFSTLFGVYGDKSKEYFNKLDKLFEFCRMIFFLYKQKFWCIIRVSKKKQTYYIISLLLIDLYNLAYAIMLPQICFIILTKCTRNWR